jgi:amidase
MRIGVGRQYFGRNAKVDKLIEAHLEALKNGGATLVDVEFPKLRSFDDQELEVLLYEFKEDLKQISRRTRRTEQDAQGPDRI